ncbi:MAG: hypothetical protein BGO97_06000 [Micrococcales bacterium 70-64]|nr:hypothetical protein [Leifsonia sp.]ODU63624.1 MAG: hypothetical protein ABT06_06005 [Leifsonia sp. SCN 70-46]OJX85315.1 MAG: hypothetical protein BGO97_06000 [Micrococcales bacterium 70-64]
MTELLPTRATFVDGAAVRIEVRGDRAAGELTVWRLGDLVSRAPYDGAEEVDLGALPAGGYGVELAQGGTVTRTAVEVGDGRRMRYGFVVDYAPDRDVAGVADLARRLHLTDIQFYDWAYRHASLLGGGEEYRDALDQPVALATVRELVTALRAAGARSLGYAAVYAVGPAEWQDWEHRALVTAGGAPYALGDFLFIVDPAAEDWLASFGDQLRAAVEHVGFDGFHLDQYGYPKRAARADGVVVDVAESFVTLLAVLRERLPDARLVFNNVNDFPTWRTARSPQDAVYIEPWAPTLTLGGLAEVVTRARSVSEGKPVVMAAYQHVYDSAPVRASDLATAFTMAALHSHGATQLLAGEADRILVDPYYVRNHVVEPSTADLLRRWYDFLVEHDELLLDPSIVDVTASIAGAYNDDCDVTFAVPVTEAATPGAVWRRITESRGRTVVHLINLVGQDDTLWDAPRREPGHTGGGTLRVRRLGTAVPRVRVADPDGGARLVDVEVTVDGDYATAQLPAVGVWQVVLVEPRGKDLA